jgi:drug/metabolite transporter (DMT)-like permease
MGAIPLLIVVLAHFFLSGEPITSPKALGFLMGFAGIIILIGPEKLFALSAGGDALWGELAILAGCVCYAVHAITAKRLGFEDPIKQTTAVCIAGAVMGLVFALYVSPHGLTGKPLIAYVAAIVLGVLPTAIASLIMYRLLNRIGPSFVAYSNYLVPPYAVLLGALLLGEELSWNVVAALLLILVGIAVSRLPAARLSRA